MRFGGRTVVVTGAASGIGRATARRFAAEGANVVAADIDVAGGEALAGEREAIHFVPTNVTDDAQIKALMDEAARIGGGGIDVVFNNAGSGGTQAPIGEMDAGGWDATMALLLRSVAMGIAHAVPHLRGRRHANIVNTASVASFGAGYAPIAYSVAKAGVLHLSKIAAAELSGDGIRVNAVCPGFINTNIFVNSLEFAGAQREMANGVIRQLSSNAQPIRRAGEPDDIAGAVLYLASEDAAFVTGTHLLVDGGLRIGERHAWDKEQPGLFEALAAMKAQAEAGAPG